MHCNRVSWRILFALVAVLALLSTPDGGSCGVLASPMPMPSPMPRPERLDQSMFPGGISVVNGTTMSCKPDKNGHTDVSADPLCKGVVTSSERAAAASPSSVGNVSASSGASSNSLARATFVPVVLGTVAVGAMTVSSFASF